MRFASTPESEIAEVLMLSRRLLRSVVVAAAAAGAWAGLAESSLAQQPSSTLRVVQQSLTRIYDPHFTTSFYTRDFGYLVFDTLLAVNEQFEPKPQMAERWEISADKLTYTFHLRDGLKWHDGQPVTAEDCIASIKRWGSRDGMGQALLSFTQEMVAIDAKSFKIVLKEPYGQVLDTLGKVGSLVPFMMPKRLAETPGTEQIKEVIGSGPFKFRADLTQPGIKIVVDKFADYVPRSEPPVWASGGKIAKVDRIEVVSIPDPSTQVNALIAGEVDYIDWLTIDLLPLIERSRTAHIQVVNQLGYMGLLRMNHLHPPFNDVRMRQAVAMAINQEDYLRALIGNPKYYKVCQSLYLCGTPLETTTGVPKRDLEKAKQLIKESGWNVSTPIVLLHVTDTNTIAPQGLVTAQVLRSLGLTVDVQAMDFQTFATRRLSQAPIGQGGWNIGHTTWTAPDVANPVVSIALNGSGPPNAWWGWPKDEEMERLRAAYARAPDAQRQKEIAEQVHVRGYDQVFFLPVGQFQAVSAMRNNVVGAITAPVMLLYNIAKQ
jgi:peptide/nickel transport system substrate-binding protein